LRADKGCGEVGAWVDRVPGLPRCAWQLEDLGFPVRAGVCAQAAARGASERAAAPICHRCSVWWPVVRHMTAVSHST
jgi:hypothetical protein